MTMRLSPELFAAYEQDGLKLDATVRQLFAIPATYYYVVEAYPPARQGIVRIERSRIPPKHKISKSDQQ